MMYLWIVVLLLNSLTLSMDSENHFAKAMMIIALLQIALLIFNG